MGMHSSHRFAGGCLVKADPPEWFAKATAKDGSWRTLLLRAGATAIEDFGYDSGADSLEIYEGPEGDYCILFRDSNKCAAEIFIDNMADYLLFRAKYVAPLATLIMESERHFDWQKGRRKLRAAS